MVVTLDRIDPPLYRCFFHNGSIVIFSSSTVRDVNVTSVMHNVTLQRKKTSQMGCLACGKWETGQYTIFYPTGEPVFGNSLG